MRNKKGAVQDFFEQLLTVIALIVVITLLVILMAGDREVKRYINEDSLALDVSRASLAALNMPTEKILSRARIETLENAPHVDDQDVSGILVKIQSRETIGQALSEYGDDKQTRCAIAQLLDTHPLLGDYETYIFGPEEEIFFYNHYTNVYDVTIIPIKNYEYIAVGMYKRGQFKLDEVCA